MRRTILGLLADDPDEPDVESAHSGQLWSLQVEEAQQDLAGRTVVSGEAAHVGGEERVVPVIEEDGTISERERMVDDPQRVEWFAVPEASPGYVCVDASGAEWVFRQLGRQLDVWVEAAHYDLGAFHDRLRADQEADVWQVVWSDPAEDGEAGTFYPGFDSDDEAGRTVKKRGLERYKKQFGFTFWSSEAGDTVRGTVARSGYLELYSPRDWGTLETARWLREQALPHAYVPEDDEEGA